MKENGKMGNVHAEQGVSKWTGPTLDRDKGLVVPWQGH